MPAGSDTFGSSVISLNGSTLNLAGAAGRSSPAVSSPSVQVIMEGTLQRSNFFYLINRDESGQASYEAAKFDVVNKLPGQKYNHVLSLFNPSGKRFAFDRNVMLRIYSRFQAPVGGIAVLEHFEVNLVPLSVRLTHNLFQHLVEFFFPARGKDTAKDAAKDKDKRTERERERDEVRV